jgi:CBS domain-containing protein
MTRRVASVHPVSSVERAVRLMEECDCGALPVLGDNSVLVVMVTSHDTLRVIRRNKRGALTEVFGAVSEPTHRAYR